MELENDTPAFDPLIELGVSERELHDTLLDAFLSCECVVLPSSPSAFNGCGVYGLYYYGDFAQYEPISNTRHNTTIPIYIGKAAPSGTRTGGAHSSSPNETKLANRLAEHRRTIEQVENLSISDFRCRYFPLESVWIRYTEQLLIDAFGPWWNRYIDGFGLHDVGAGREGSEMSVWDALHPGRDWVEKRNLTHPTSQSSVWDDCVKPKLEQAKDNRTYKDKHNLDEKSVHERHAPSVEETCLFDFTSN